MNTFLLRTAIVSITLFAFGAAFASGPVAKTITPNSSAMERTLQRHIDKLVTYPLRAAAGTMDGEVVVSFVIDTEGKVNVLRAESTNEVLEVYVLEQLTKVDIGSNPAGTWKTTHLRFRFMPEK